MITRSGAAALMVAVVLLVTGRVFALLELFVLGAAALVLVALAIAYVAVRRLRIEVRRRLAPPRVHAGQPCRVDLALTNRGRLRSPVLSMRDHISGTHGVELMIAPLKPDETTQAVYRLPTHRRGVISIGPLQLAVTDPFGLARMITTTDQEVALLVYPRVDVIDAGTRATGSDLERETLHQHQVAPLGDEFYALREYAMGDDLRRVHWPSSARHDDLMVRQDETPWQGRLTVLLDLRPGPSPEVFEEMVSAAASIAIANARQADQVRIVASDGQRSAWGTGPTHLDRILGLLAVVDPSERLDGEQLDQLTKSATGSICLVTARAGELRSGPLQRAAAAHRSRVVVLFSDDGAMHGGGATAVRSTFVVHVTPSTSFMQAWSHGLRARRTSRA